MNLIDEIFQHPVDGVFQVYGPFAGGMSFKERERREAAIPESYYEDDDPLSDAPYTANGYPRGMMGL